MAPKSILKRAAPLDLEIEEVPQAGPGPASEERQMPESESSEDDDEEGDSDEEMDGDSYDDSDEDGDDEDEIREMGGDGKRAPKKLKHTTLRPTPAPAFSLALTHLLSLPPSTSTLKPKFAPPSAATQRLERRAKTLLRETKSNHLARGHVRDVIVGWGARPPIPFGQWESSSAREFHAAQNGEVEVETGAEREKRLRKLAQRGVVRLFNAIGAAQGAPDKAAREEKKRQKELASQGGSVATTTVAELMEGAGTTKLRRPNILGGRGRAEGLSNLSAASFLDLIRAPTSQHPGRAAIRS